MFVYSSMSSAVVGAIKKAISMGAPLYNQGFPEKCYQLYRDTAAMLKDSPSASSAEVSVLTDALDQAAKNADTSESAWIMRRAFDSILDGSAATRANLLNIPPGQSEVSLLDFSENIPSTPSWFVLDDVIMGGVSRSNWAWDTADKAAMFTGLVTTDSNGGFASIRSSPWSGWGIPQAKGLRLCVKGDARTYKVTTKMDDDFDGVQYQHDFATTADGKWQVVDLPYAHFKPNFRGRLVTGRPPVRPAQVRQLGLMVSKFSDAGGLTANFKSGNFRLAVKWIKGIL